MIDIEFENRRGDELRNSGDYAGAVRCYRRAAANECPQAIFKLGRMYYQGLGVARSYRLAAALFLRAAEENVVEAQRSLAALFRYGRYVPVDYDLSQKWDSVCGSAENLLQVLHRTLEFIDPEMISEVFRHADTPGNETEEAIPPTPAKPYIVHELDEQGYAVGEDGRSARIRRNILRHFPPVRAAAMLEEMIARNGDPAALADLTADLNFIRKQQ